MGRDGNTVTCLWPRVTGTKVSSQCTAVKDIRLCQVVFLFPERQGGVSGTQQRSSSAGTSVRALLSPQPAGSWGLQPARKTVSGC